MLVKEISSTLLEKLHMILADVLRAIRPAKRCHCHDGITHEWKDNMDYMGNILGSTFDQTLIEFLFV